LIHADQPVLILAVLLGLLVLAFALERTRIGKVLPGPAVMLVGAVILSNTGLMPHKAGAYSELARVAVPVAVFMLLLRANLRQILRETGSILTLYLIGAATSILGIVVAWLVIPIDEASKIAAVQTANLVGGTVNVVAVAHALELDPTHFSAMLAGGAPVMTFYLMSMGVLAANPLLNRWLPGRTVEPAEAEAEPAPAVVEVVPDPPRATALSLAILIAGAFGTFAIGEAALKAVGLGQYLIILVTLVSLAVANLAPRQVDRLSGDREIGSILMYLFFGTLGFDVDLMQFGGEAVRVALFILLAMAVHMVLILSAGRLLKADLGEVLVASIAGVAGPTTAAAMAASFGRRSLITPGILCGLLGFAGATFVAMALYGVMAGLGWR
jgi:uncharacterized membrane protein